MPRRTLLLIATAVLALHWWVLAGVPLHWDRPATAQPPQVFTTRTVATPPPAPAQAPPAAAPVRRPPPRKKAPVPASTPSPAPAVAASAEASLLGPPPGATDPEPLANRAPDPETDNQASAPSPDPAAETAPDHGPGPQPLLAAEAPDAPSEAPAPAPAAGTTAAIDIAVPGAGAPGDSAAPRPVRIPPPVRLDFEVSGQAKKLHYSARAELLWQHDGQHYQARQEIKLLFLGARTQTSEGDIAAGGLQPRRFGDRARSEQAAHFDYAHNRITFSANTPEAVLVPGTQDRLSVFLQLGALLAAAPERYPVGTRISVATASARAADVWSFTIEGEETLDLPVGATPALKLERLPRRDYDQKAELWLAPALGYLPVRIRLTQANGDFADLRLSGHAAP
ncbi:hypothetical protein B2J86_09990 [Acidovorax sp. SRB_14]|nr:hypothetical protein [Acidovorax sp. SRB_14]